MAKITITNEVKAYVKVNPTAALVLLQLDHCPTIETLSGYTEMCLEQLRGGEAPKPAGALLEMDKLSGDTVSEWAEEIIAHVRGYIASHPEVENTFIEGEKDIRSLVEKFN